LIAAEPCRLCGRSFSPHDLIGLAVLGGWKLCLNCYGWQQDAMLVLGGKKPPAGCAECGRSWTEIQAHNAGLVQPGAPRIEQGSRMYLHALSGVYVLLCGGCSDKVVRLTKERYLGTPFGEEQRL
jgi:hypothetical protein